MTIGTPTSFRRPHTVVREQPGLYVDGVWVPGARIEIQISATVQPATTGDYDRIQAEQGGDRLHSMVRIYTGTELYVADQRSAVTTGGTTTYQAGDVLMWPPLIYGTPERYRVIARSRWISGLSVDHYRYLAALEP